MSGTSLDGLDLCYVHLSVDENGRWQFELQCSESIPYSAEWRLKLSAVEAGNALGYALLDVALGRYFGEQVKAFISKHQLQVDFIASHGHTVFHQPSAHYLTTQLGHGAQINAVSGVPVFCDFRTADVALGGQGAPLVPIGDRLLFADYDFCLNLGGIANISLEEDGVRKAFDIGVANMPLNYFVKSLGLDFDEEGKIARSGQVDQAVFEALNALPFFEKFGVKSLGKEWVFSEVIPRLETIGKTNDQLATAVEHAAYQIGRCLGHFSAKQKGKCLVTGGGAFNQYFLERIAFWAEGTTLIIPGEEIIEQKEALIFALLGVLKYRHEVNCLASVTGAKQDHSAGQLFDYQGKLSS